MPDFSKIFTTSTHRKSFVTAVFLAFFAVSAWASHDKVADKHAQTSTAASHDVAIESHNTSESHAKEAHGDAHEASGESHKEEKFAPGKMIMDHIADAHDWHLWGEGHEAVSISLPVILYVQSKGLINFSSANFQHGHAAYEGFILNEMGSVVWEDEKNTEAIYDISITKNVLAMMLAVLTLMIITIGMARSYSKRQGKAPKGFHNLVEPLIVFIRDDVARASIGHKADKYLPMLLSIFFFIFVNNIFGLIPIFPGGANVTGNIAVTMVLAVIVFLTVNLNANKYYWKHIFVPDVPVWMYIIIIPIEILGVVLKPFVLMLRLFANITAGHIIILGFFSLIFIF